MPNVSEKKLKLLYLARLLWERTDGQHAVTLSQMMEELEAKGISAERKSLYDDLETLRRFGFDIRTRKGRTFEYYLAERPFSEKDLRCLVDAVRSDSELSKRRSGELVKKLVGLGSQYQGLGSQPSRRKADAGVFSGIAVPSGEAFWQAFQYGVLAWWKNAGPGNWSGGQFPVQLAV